MWIFDWKVGRQKCHDCISSQKFFPTPDNSKDMPGRRRCNSGSCRWGCLWTWVPGPRGRSCTRVQSHTARSWMPGTAASCTRKWSPPPLLSTPSREQLPSFWRHRSRLKIVSTRVDPLTSIMAVLARSCQILSTSWQPWIPWQDSY